MTKTEKQLVADSIRGLASGPRPKGFTSVEGLPGFYRIKAKDYRIVYTIDEGNQVIIVGRIAHRREVYRRLADVTSAINVFVSRR